MRILSMFNKTPEFQPTVRVDVYQRPVPTEDPGERVKIGEVLSDGQQGELKVLDPRFQRQLHRLFEEPRTRMAEGGFRGPDGLQRDGDVQVLEPFQQETLEHVVQEDLGLYLFSGELVRLG